LAKNRDAACPALIEAFSEIGIWPDFQTQSGEPN